MRIFVAVLLGLILANLGPVPASRTSLPAQVRAAGPECAGAGRTFVRTTLYFGLSRPTGGISEYEWQTFLHEDVTPRFPEGLTVWEADGQWRRPDESIAHERAKVLLLVHDGSAKAQKSIADVVARYKRTFQQQSVLWESASVCAAF